MLYSVNVVMVSSALSPRDTICHLLKTVGQGLTSLILSFVCNLFIMISDNTNFTIITQSDFKMFVGGMEGGDSILFLISPQK